MVEQLLAKGHEVEVVTAMPNYPVGKIFPEYRHKLYCREIWHGISVHRFWVYASTGSGIRRLLNYFSFSLTCLFGIFFARKPDLIFVESPPLFLSIPARLLSLMWHRPFIFNVADLWPDSVREMGVMRDGVILRMAGRLELWSYRKAAFVNAVTDGVRRTLVEKKGVPPEKVLLLPNGANTELFRNGVRDEELAKNLGLSAQRVILYAGTLGLFHGLDIAIEAAEILQFEIPDFTLVFIGGGSDRNRLELLAKSKGLTNVRFLEPQPPEMVARLFSISYAGLASFMNRPVFEGTRPAKLIPMMASEKPVVFSGAGEGARLVLQAGAGIVTAPESVSSLVEGLRAVLNDPSMAQEFGRNGRKFVEANLTWRILVRNWLEDLTCKLETSIASSTGGG
jgi:glycosyltransferase involved in cell wall biosynthesis